MNIRSIDYKIIHTYLDEIEICQTDNEDLCTKYTNGDQSARELLIRANIGLVRLITKKFLWTITPSYDVEDLLSDAMMALITAVDTYDRTRNIKFSTYASNVIRNNLSRCVMELSRIIRIPVRVYRLLNVDNPSDKDKKKVSSAKVVMDVDNVGSKFPDIEYTCDLDHNLLLEEISQISCGILSNRERDIVNMVVNGYNYQIIGEKYGVSKQRIKQIFDRAIGKIRDKI